MRKGRRRGFPSCLAWLWVFSSQAPLSPSGSSWPATPPGGCTPRPLPPQASLLAACGTPAMYARHSSPLCLCSDLSGHSCKAYCCFLSAAGFMVHCVRGRLLRGRLLRLPCLCCRCARSWQRRTPMSAWPLHTPSCRSATPPQCTLLLHFFDGQPVFVQNIACTHDSKHDSAACACEGSL